MAVRYRSLTTPKVIASLTAFGASRPERIRPILARSAERVQGAAQADSPVGKTGKMRASVRIDAAEDGLGYTVGWHRSDFAPGGKVYSYERLGGVVPIFPRAGTGPGASGIVPLEAGFYVGFVVFGTRKVPGRDPLSPALAAERPVLLRELRAGLGSLR